MDYVALSPGPALDVATMITVEGNRSTPPDSLYLTTVYSDMNVTVAKWMRAKVAHDVLLLPRTDLVPSSMDTQEYLQVVSDMMEESKTVAKIAALRYLGYEVKATGEGATLETLLPGNRAEGVLKEGDVILQVEGQPVQTATDVVNAVRQRLPGENVSLTVRREGEQLQAQVGTKESDSEPGIAVVGILVKTYNFGHNLPIQVEIDSENIGGPSAGLMFALGIVDGIERGNLTAGHRVAGTGTISLDGTVGRVGGVGQKVAGAEQAGAEYFLVPRDELQEAEAAAKRLRVVPVDTLRDAALFLKGLEEPTATPVAAPRFDLQPVAPVA